jgi:hypothetical protein
MKAQVPSSVDLYQFNELYIDERRAIVAKYPNGNPSTQGLYAQDPGFSYDSESWVPPTLRAGVDINIQQPNRSGARYPNYHLSLGEGDSVFNLPRSFWSTTHAVPRGVIVKNGSLPHLSNWSKPTTGFVHAFHGGYWGSWIFEIASSNSTQNTVMFGRGGFQEARGSKSGGAFYVSNIFEELDSPNEWFLDKDTRTLYFMPNDTMPKVFVASQIPCLISVSGGGTIYLTNTQNVAITHNLLTQLGSNAVALIDYNDATLITLNEFVWLADSAIILVGSTNGIDGDWHLYQTIITCTDRSESKYICH